MNKDAIVSYVAQGFKDDKIATILGCTAPYISEVRAEEWFAAALEDAKKKIKLTEEAVKLEDSYMKLEASVLSNLNEQMPFADFKDLVRLTETLIRRRQGAIPIGGIVFNQQNNQTVLLQIPASVAPEIVKNNNNEVVAIGNKTLAPMPIHGVRRLFEHIQNEREQPAKIAAILAEGRLLETVPEDF